MKSYIGIWRSARHSMEWGVDYANKGSGEILGEAATAAEAYTAAGEYDKANGGDGDIGRRWRIANPTGSHCVDCLAALAPWDDHDPGICSACAARK